MNKIVILVAILLVYSVKRMDARMHGVRSARRLSRSHPLRRLVGERYPPPPGTFETCDEFKTYGVREGGASVQCANIMVDACCDECLYNQMAPSCGQCMQEMLNSNYEALVANQCIASVPNIDRSGYEN